MYILEMSKLNPGDIFLTGNDEKVSRVVRKFTSGSYSHAILYVGNGSYIHSDRDGVHANNIQRLLFESDQNVTVLRLKSHTDLTDVCEYARTQIGKEYSIKGAVNAKAKLKAPFGNNRQFCSKLVAEAYDFIGVKLSKDTDHCTPKDIEDCNILQPVSDAVRLATEEEIDLATSDSPLTKQTEATNQILNEARKVSNKDIQTLQEVLEYVCQNPESDGAISKVVRESGYLTLFDGELSKNSWRYNYLEFIALPLSKEDLTAMVHREMKSSEDLLDRFGRMLIMYTQLHENYKLEFTFLHKELYSKLVKNAIAHNDTAKKVYELIT